MARAWAWLVAAALHFGVPTLGALGYVWADSPPEPVQFGRIICVFPADEFNSLSLVQGAPEPEVDLLFGVPPGERVVGAAYRCVRYEYSPELAYVVRFHEGLAEHVSLVAGGVIPRWCGVTLARTVHAPKRPWYPSELPPDRNLCCGGDRACPID